MSSTERVQNAFTLPENGAISWCNRLGENSLLGALCGDIVRQNQHEQADVVDLSCATQIDFPQRRKFQK